MCVWGRAFCKKNGFYNKRSTHNHVVDFATKYTRAFLFFDCFLHLCYKSIFSELGQMLPHPTHDSVKSSPNVRLSCPTQYCLYRCSQLVLFSPCETLDEPVYSVTFCSRVSTPDAGIIFLVVTKITQTTLVFHFVLQTAHPTAHNRFTLFDANGRPNSKWSP